MSETVAASAAPSGPSGPTDSRSAPAEPAREPAPEPARDPHELDAAIENGENSAETRAHEAERHAANMRAIEGKAADDRLRAEAGTPQARYREAMEEAAREQSERADPDTAPLVDARDHAAAGGRFAEADATQKLIDRVRQDREHREFFDPPSRREAAAREAHERFPFWRDQDRPAMGPTDRPGAHTRDRGERSRPAREQRQR